MDLFPGLDVSHGYTGCYVEMTCQVELEPVGMLDVDFACWTK